ncbi:MAG TPA: PQQ-dependent sugar dehydrogenase [candidate division Zixibacteria bacterium]|nr:PQQ-dependent sugar dehydrogenase [candidate division Zixibacteria bacterium]
MKISKQALKLGGLLVISMLIWSTMAKSQTPLAIDTVASGLVNPVLVTFAPGDSTRIFILEQPGRIRVVRNDTLIVTPFMDIDPIVGSSGSEQGLLGLAFHPNYQSNKFFYVNYTNNSGNTVVARYSVTGNPDVADPNSALTILTIAQPFSNHNGGMIAFGPSDGYLYIGMGDGGSGGDPGNRAQNPLNILGKMLRIDVNSGSPYAIPPSNPFVGNGSYLPEIWALGLRNPWRFSFDRVTGDLWTADVGQGEIEEIDFQDGSSTGGENYGWRLMEGDSCFDPPDMCDTLVGLAGPVTFYTHGGSPFRCSVTGGYVYRGCAIPDLQGHYFYGDYCSGQIWSFRYDGVNISDSTQRTSDLAAGSIGISSFGEDFYGELYICSHGNGRVLKIIPQGVPSQCSVSDCCTGIRGDVNGDNNNGNIIDLNFLVNYVFRSSGNAGPCLTESDVNGDSSPADILDLNYLVNRIFRGGPEMPAC